MNPGKILSTLAGFALLAGLAYHQVRVNEPGSRIDSELAGTAIDLRSESAAYEQESESVRVNEPTDCDADALVTGPARSPDCDKELAMENRARELTEPR